MYKVPSVIRCLTKRNSLVRFAGVIVATLSVLVWEEEIDDFFEWLNIFGEAQEESYYAVLGLINADESTEAEIKKQFRKVPSFCRLPSSEQSFLPSCGRASGSLFALLFPPS